VTLTILVPLLVAVAGIVLHALPIGGPTLKEVAKAMIWGGVVVTLLVVSHQTVRL